MNRDIRFHVKRGGFLRRQWRFTIVAANHEIIATSELYKNRVDCEATIARIQTGAADAQVITI